MKFKYSAVLIWIIFFQLVGFLIGLQTSAAIKIWYSGLNQSSLTPPNLVFPIVWTILYIVIAIVGYSIWNNRHKPGGTNLLLLFGFQVLLNWSWSPLFFNLHLITASLACIIILTLINSAIVYKMIRPYPGLALLFIPYLLWLCFATYLNFYIWLNN